MEKDIASLQHTTWRCQYHVVFAPKYRRMVIYGQIRADIGQVVTVHHGTFYGKYNTKYF